MRTVVDAQDKRVKLELKELYRYRELLWVLSYRDFRVRYAQTGIGFIWAFINPLLTLLVLSFVFGVVAKVEVVNNGQVVPHLLYTTAGMCGWTYFSTVMAEGGASVLNAEGMVKKIYFPRLVLPLSKALTAFIEFGIMLLSMFIMMFIYGVGISWELAFLPLFILMAILAGLTAGIWMSALTIRFRDFHHMLPLLLRLGMYATPIAYPSSAVPEQYQILFYLNPIAGVVEGMRWSLIGGTPPSSYAYFSFIFVAILFFAGVYYFKKIEKIAADIL